MSTDRGAEHNRYRDFPGHPLAGVDQAVLDVARAVLDDAVIWNDVAADDAHPLADAVVAALVEAGYITSRHDESEPAVPRQPSDDVPDDLGPVTHGGSDL